MKVKLAILIFILVLAAILRIVGVYPGYHPNHSDEVNIYSSTVSMLKDNNFEPSRYEYPPLPDYINLIFFKFFFIPVSWERFYLQNIGQVIDGTLPLKPNILTYNSLLQLNILGDRDINTMFWVRTVTAIFGVGIVFLTYLLGKDLFDEYTGLISSFLVCLNYRQVLNSHFGLPDIYNAFFLIFAFWVTIRIIRKPSFINYFLAAIACGLSFSVKYQFFSFIPLFLVHLLRVFDEKNLKSKVEVLFDPASICVPLVIGAVFLLLNPYFIIHFDIAKSQLDYVALKYRFGKNFFDFYPFSYLYNYGIGRLTSLLILIGMPLVLIKNFKKCILLLGVIVPFFYITTYATGGGFYTRNFVTITPLLLIFPGFLFSSLFSRIKSIKFKNLLYILFLTLILFVGFENFKNDVIVLTNYVKPWNQDVMIDWIQKNIPSDSLIAAHSSVPIPDNFKPRLSYDFYPSFSVDEFAQEKAQWAISNYEWETNDFYWWMTQDTLHSLKYWQKPVSILSETYPGMALRELEDFAVYSLNKPALAPDANFLVAKIPNFEVSKRELSYSFDFMNSSDGWISNGNNLVWEKGNLVSKKDGSGDPYTRWESPFLGIGGNTGLEIDYKMKTIETLDKREGFIFIEFYKQNKEIGVRLSKRNDVYNKLVDGKLFVEIPYGVDKFKIGFQVYNPNIADVYLSGVKVYGANVKNLNADGTHHINIDTDIVFPISQGNL